MTKREKRQVPAAPSADSAPTSPPVQTTDRDEDLRVGVSMCLLGEQVRYDGGHKRHHYVCDVLGRYFTFVPVCPEVELGLGTPRETLRLVRDADSIRMVAQASGTDHTPAMTAYAAGRARQLATLDLDGYVLKRDSPSCGMERVRTYTTAGMPSPSARGLFADALIKELPLLPVEEEGRLGDATLRESFVERVFAHNRLRRLFRGRWTIKHLIEFQAAEKYLLMAHSPQAQRELGRLVADARQRSRSDLAAEYRDGFMSAIRRPIPKRRHVNVLHHLLGFFKRELGDDEKRELIEAIDDFSDGRTPLLVPLTLIRHHIRRNGLEYLAVQSYLSPHPKELMLRNHV